MFLMDELPGAKTATVTVGKRGVIKLSFHRACGGRGTLSLFSRKSFVGNLGRFPGPSFLASAWTLRAPITLILHDPCVLP